MKDKVVYEVNTDLDNQTNEVMKVLYNFYVTVIKTWELDQVGQNDLI